MVTPVSFYSFLHVEGLSLYTGRRTLCQAQTAVVLRGLSCLLFPLDKVPDRFR